MWDYIVNQRFSIIINVAVATLILLCGAMWWNAMRYNVCVGAGMSLMGLQWDEAWGLLERVRLEEALLLQVPTLNEQGTANVIYAYVSLSMVSQCTE